MEFRVDLLPLVSLSFSLNIMNHACYIRTPGPSYISSTVVVDTCIYPYVTPTQNLNVQIQTFLGILYDISIYSNKNLSQTFFEFIMNSI